MKTDEHANTGDRELLDGHATEDGQQIHISTQMDSLSIVDNQMDSGKIVEDEANFDKLRPNHDGEFVVSSDKIALTGEVKSHETQEHDLLSSPTSSEQMRRSLNMGDVKMED